MISDTAMIVVCCVFFIGVMGLTWLTVSYLSRKPKPTKPTEADFLKDIPDELLTPDQLAQRKAQQPSEPVEEDWEKKAKIIELKAKVKGDTDLMAAFEKDYSWYIEHGFPSLAEDKLKDMKRASKELPINKSKLAKLLSEETS